MCVSGKSIEIATLNTECCVTSVLSDLLDVRYQCFPVGQPFSGQGRCRRKLIAAQLQRDLEAVGVQVVEVLHACSAQK